MKEKARNLVYLNTKRYVSLADLNKLKWAALFISLILFVIGLYKVEADGFNWKSVFPIISALIWNLLYWKFVHEIKSRKTTFELRFLANGLFGVFLFSLIWVFFTSFNLSADTPIVDNELCLWSVFVYLMFTIIYIGLIVFGVHNGAFEKIRKFGNSSIVLALDALLASLIPLAVVLGRLRYEAISHKSVSAQNKEISVVLILLSIFMAMTNINFVQYYYCKKYGFLCDEDGDTTSPYLER